MYERRVWNFVCEVITSLCKVRSTCLIWLLTLFIHLYLSVTWLGVAPRLYTKETNICLKDSGLHAQIWSPFQTNLEVTGKPMPCKGTIAWFPLDLGKPAQTLVPYTCWMLKPLPPSNHCMGWFAPAIPLGSHFGLFPPWWLYLRYLCNWMHSLCAPKSKEKT